MSKICLTDRSIESVFGSSPFPKCIIVTCLPVPVSAKTYHGFKYSFAQRRINICVHIQQEPEPEPEDMLL